MPNNKRNRCSRQGKRNNRRIGVYKDVINVELDPGSSIGYKTSDVRFNADRAYRIQKVVGWLTSNGPAVAQISIQSPNSRLTSRECASSGPIPVGVIPQKVVCVNKDKEFIPAGNTADLFNIDNLCLSKTLKFNIIGTLHVYIQFLEEMLSEACPKVWTAQDHPGPFSSTSSSFTSL